MLEIYECRTAFICKIKTITNGITTHMKQKQNNSINVCEKKIRIEKTKEKEISER